MKETDNSMDEQDQTTEAEAVQAGDDVQQDVAEQEESIQEISVDALQIELAAAQEKITVQQEDVLRAQAEMMNTRRRAEQDIAKAHKFGQEKLVAEILGLIDNLERAIKASKSENATLENLLEGVEMSQTMLLDGLKKFNVKQLDPHGEPFDPALHEAMTAVPNPDMEPNTVMEVFQKGYTLNGRLIRPAMVVVTKAP